MNISRFFCLTITLYVGLFFMPELFATDFQQIDTSKGATEKVSKNDTSKKLSPQEKKKALKQKMAERKALQKEKVAALKEKRKEKERLKKEQLKAKKEEQKALVKLKQNAPNKVLANELKESSEKSVANIKESAQEEINKVKSKVNDDTKLLVDASNKTKTEKAIDTFRKPRKKKNRKIKDLVYDFPKKELSDDGFVKYGRLYQFHLQGLNPKLYHVFISGDNCTQNAVWDSSLASIYDRLKSLPLMYNKTELTTSLMHNAPWLDFFKKDNYKSAITPNTYKDYVTNFNAIKAELKKQAISYKDFVGVLETNTNKKLPMQYELLDTTFYKSYYLLFVSRVDLLKDYYSAFINQIASLDTIRYKEVLSYKKKTELSVARLVESKKKIELALDTLSQYIQTIGEYYNLMQTDPIAYTSEEIAGLKDKFFASFQLTKEADTAGATGVTNILRNKIYALKKNIKTNLAINNQEIKALYTHLLQSQDYTDIYQKRYTVAMNALEQMNTFVDKELSLQNRNIRFSEIVENLYKRLMLEYENMRNNVKDNSENMYDKVQAYSHFIGNDLSYDKIREDYQKLEENTKFYVQDSLYVQLVNVVGSVYTYLSNSDNFDIVSQPRRVKETDFVNYHVSVLPKKNLPSNLVVKYDNFTRDFRFPVYGGFVHTLSFGLGTNLSFVRNYNLTPVQDNTAGLYTITQDGKQTKAKFNLSTMYNFFYRTKNPNFKYGGGVGLLLDLTDLLHLQNTKFLIGPSLLFYDRFVVTTGITLGAEQKLKNIYKPGQQINIYNNFSGDINNVKQQLHNEAFAVGFFISLGISIF